LDDFFSCSIDIGQHFSKSKKQSITLRKEIKIYNGGIIVSYQIDDSKSLYLNFSEAQIKFGQ
jgi:hypothetical protein